MASFHFFVISLVGKFTVDGRLVVGCRLNLHNFFVCFVLQGIITTDQAPQLTQGRYFKSVVLKNNSIVPKDKGSVLSKLTLTLHLIDIHYYNVTRETMKING